MIRLTTRRMLWGLVIGALVLGCLDLPKAEAYWRYWRWRGPAMWTCGYGDCWDGCWYLGLRRGPIRRLLFGRYRWYYVPGCCYSPCYVTTCSVCWSVPCCCWDSCDTGTVVSSTVPVEIQEPTVPEHPVEAKPISPTPKPAQEPEAPSKLPGPGGSSPTPAPPMPGPGQTFHEPTRSDSGLLTLYVPYDAKVFINGLPTRTTGSRRQYVSYGLLPGYRYKYEVRVEIIREGTILEETKVVYLTAGSKEALAFGFNVRSVEGLAVRP
ncbi:MAG: TIGR03000 domain-containing protein [Thermoguttaceae bacterium]|nr:TIGR03000 domain-containing protein [Thermoguttaceae bacterium]MDW8037313.1 TIGR03000 domain-containing protein [Thermoguttaceae bacterium]